VFAPDDGRIGSRGQGRGQADAEPEEQNSETTVQSGLRAARTRAPEHLRAPGATVARPRGTGVHPASASGGPASHRAAGSRPCPRRARPLSSAPR
jgi:hypothetical protein